MGIFLPILFIFFSIFNNTKNIKTFFKESFFLLFIFLFFFFIFWPYLWSQPINKIINLILNPTANLHSLFILFDGKYYLTTHLPDNYLFTWILITNPLPILILSAAGFFFLFYRLFHRVSRISDACLYKDMWRGNMESFDYFCLVSFFSILFVASTFSLPFISGWRHFYFLHFFIIYGATFFVRSLIIKFKKKKLIFIILIFLVLINVKEIIKFHPYQSLYFNNLLTSEKKNNFQIDMPALSRNHALKIILEDSNKEMIKVSSASFVPFKNGADLLTKESKKKLIFLGNEYDKSDYIYTNLIYEVDIEYNNKYKIPDSFEIFYTHSINEINIFKIYKKKK